MKKSIHLEILISAIGAGVFSVILALLLKQDIAPLFLSTWFIVFLLLIIYEFREIISCHLNKGYHRVIQGEDIDYASCFFDKVADDADETGETIVNNLNWRLAFDIPDVLKSGNYMANIRIRKTNQFARGTIRFNIETSGGNNGVARKIDISKLREDEYSYVDHKFHYKGNGSIKVIIEPDDDDAKAQHIFAFDRLELYEICGGLTQNKPTKPFANFITFTIGYLLSPLSWWNDLFINIPIAYAFALIAKIVSHNLFQPIFILAYVATNIAGMILMDIGKNEFYQRRLDARYYIKSSLISIIYVAIILFLSNFNFVQTPKWPF